MDLLLVGRMRHRVTGSLHDSDMHTGACHPAHKILCQGMVSGRIESEISSQAPGGS
jgi:hypothetical protein